MLENELDWEKSKYRLFYAVGHDLKEECELFLSMGDDVNQKEEQQGWTPLHLAVFTQNKEMVQFLLEKGADIESTMEGEITPLILAALRGYAEIAELLILYGADVNFRSIDNCTPLFAAVLGGNLQVIRVLLKYEADPDLKNDHGLTALDFSSNDETKKIVADIFKEYNF